MVGPDTDYAARGSQHLDQLDALSETKPAGASEV